MCSTKALACYGTRVAGARAIEDVDASEICRRFGSSILRRCAAIVRDAAAAEDVAQEVFVTILAKASQFRGDAELGTWIYRITTNLCLNHLRAAKRRVAREHGQVSADATDPYAAYAAWRQLRDLLGPLDRLSQQIFVLKFLDGMTQEEIAAVTGRSRRTVGKRLKRIEALVSDVVEGAA